MAKKFRKKPLEIEAVQWVGNSDDLNDFAGNFFKSPEEFSSTSTAEIYDRLHSTWINVYPGQWVVKGVRGEFYPIDEGVLEETYIPLCVVCGHPDADHVHAAVGACLCGCDGPMDGVAPVWK